MIFVEGFYEIVCALEEIMSEDNNKVVASLHKSLCDFSFIITICKMEKDPWLDLFYLKIFANGKFRSNYCFRVCKRNNSKT